MRLHGLPLRRVPIDPGNVVHISGPGQRALGQEENHLMRITKKAIAGIAALALAAGGGVLMMTSADAATTTPTAGVVPGDNTVTSRTVKDGSLYQSDFNQDVINKVFRVPGFQS